MGVAVGFGVLVGLVVAVGFGVLVSLDVEVDLGVFVGLVVEVGLVVLVGLVVDVGFVVFVDMVVTAGLGVFVGLAITMGFAVFVGRAVSVIALCVAISCPLGDLIQIWPATAQTTHTQISDKRTIKTIFFFELFFFPCSDGGVDDIFPPGICLFCRMIALN